MHLFRSVSAVSESRLSSEIARNETNFSHWRQQCFFVIFLPAPFPFAWFFFAPLSFSFFFCSTFCFVSDAARGRENSWLARNDYETFMAERTRHTKPKKGPQDGVGSNLLYLEPNPPTPPALLHHSHIVGQSSEAFIGRHPQRPIPFLADGIS